MESLPRELLCLILAFVPTAPRLAFASLVCRRWRAAAIEVTTSLSDPRSLERAARILPALERLTLTRAPIELASTTALPSLRRLSLRSFAMPIAGTHHELSLRRLLEHRTTLTHVELTDPAEAQWAELLRASAPSIPSLSVTCASRTGFSVLALDYPRLTSLSLAVSPSNWPDVAPSIAALQGLIERTSAHLETLELAVHHHSAAPLWDAIARIALPNVRRLAVNCNLTLYPAFAALLAHCHPAVGLALTCNKRALRSPGPVAAALTDLTLVGSSGLDVDEFLSSLAACPRLRSLALLDSAEVVVERVSQSPLAPLVTSARVSAGDLRHAGSLTRLTHLTLSLPHSDPVHIPTLPSVTSLTIVRGSYLSSLSGYLRCFPNVRTLRAETLRLTQADLVAFAASHQGLEHCILAVRSKGKGFRGVLTLPHVTIVVRHV